MEKKFGGLIPVYRRMVVKIGTNLLSGVSGKIETGFMDHIARQIALLHQKGIEVLLVTSGAIGAGMNEMGLKERPRTLPDRQAMAAIGQSRLMHVYDEVFSEYNLRVAQVLLTESDLKDRHHYLNARNTLLRLLELKVVPIINENDTVAVDELKIGDNDTLSARVAAKVGADVLVLLTDVEGLYTKNPNQYKDAEIIHQIDKLTPDILALAGKSINQYGTGGMMTKLLAAKAAMSSGVTMYIARGTRENTLLEIAQGDRVGTQFIPNKKLSLSSRERWIAFGSGRTQYRIIIDDGAKKALVEKNKSLLPSGIIKIEGVFKTGDIVQVLDLSGSVIARGLVNYRSDELDQIKGMKTSQISAILKHHKGYDEAIHKDNLVLMTTEE